MADEGQETERELTWALFVRLQRLALADCPVDE